MSKLALHLQSIPRDIALFPAEWVKIIDPPEQNPCPGKMVIGRTYMTDEESNALVWQGAVGATTWFNRWKSFYSSRGYVHCWEGPNEPQPMGNKDFRAALNAFTVRLAQLMRASGLTLVGHNWAVGWPDIGHAVEFRNSITELEYLDHYLGIHEYSARTMLNGGGFETLRYRKTFNELRAAGIPIPPTIIGECGIDGGVLKPPEPKCGWQVYTNEDNYLEQLKWYDSEIKKDREIVTATIFTICDWDWHTFNLTDSLIKKLASYIESDTEEQVVYALGVDVSEHQGDISWKALWDYGVRFAFIRLGDGLYRDPEFDRNWTEAGNLGILRGAYHYARHDKDGQAAFIDSVLGDKVPELGVWGDLEDEDFTTERIDRYMTYTKLRTELPLGVYSSPRLLNIWSPLPESVTSCDLWIASPGVPEPVMPKLYWEDWTFWQFGQRQIDGRTVDVDYYNGTVEDLISRYSGEDPVDPVDPVDPSGGDIKYTWYDGTQVTEEAFRNEFGEFTVTIGGEYHVSEMIAITGPSTFRFRVIDASGNPMPGVSVVWYWPDAPLYPGSGYDGRGVECITKDNGWAEASMGLGAYYWPDDPSQGKLVGPHKAWIYGEKSDLVSGIGMIGQTEHDHFDVVVSPSVTPPPQTTYTLTTSVAGSGTVSGGGVYNAGAIASATANASDGWSFVGWAGSVTSIANPVSIKMDSNKNITANFVASSDPIADKVASARMHLAEADADLVEVQEMLK